MRAPFSSIGLIMAVLSAPILSSRGADLQAISLPPPKTNGGKPLMTALSQRRTTREFAPGGLSPQELSNLLWAAFGINRPESDHRTAPSAMNSQETELYVALPDALYVYDPKANHLKPIVSGDLRSMTSGQAYIKEVPVVLIYVADLSRLEKAKPEAQNMYAAFDAGCICQNVYLYCASAGLATVVYELIRAPLAKAMNLRSDQQIIFAQAVGKSR